LVCRRCHSPAAPAAGRLPGVRRGGPRWPAPAAVAAPDWAEACRTAPVAAARSWPAAAQRLQADSEAFSDAPVSVGQPVTNAHAPTHHVVTCIRTPLFTRTCWTKQRCCFDVAAHLQSIGLAQYVPSQGRCTVVSWCGRIGTAGNRIRSVGDSTCGQTVPRRSSC
jgi:hypothetical protein